IGSAEELARQEALAKKGALGQLREDVKKVVGEQETGIEEDITKKQEEAARQDTLLKSKIESVKKDLKDFQEKGFDINRLQNYLKGMGLLEKSSNVDFKSEINKTALSASEPEIRKKVEDEYKNGTNEFFLEQANRLGLDTSKDRGKTGQFLWNTYPTESLKQDVLNALSKERMGQLSSVLSSDSADPLEKRLNAIGIRPDYADVLKNQVASQTKNLYKDLLNNLEIKETKGLKKESFYTPEQIARKKALAKISGKTFTEPTEKYEKGSIKLGKWR
ncbi:hypothetical protein EBU94_06395, partial [bacterium]|nr:hypothetical protein [bacterium]